LFDRNNQAFVVFDYLASLDAAPSRRKQQPALAFVGAGLFRP
jgi:hypothetical protein